MAENNSLSNHHSKESIETQKPCFKHSAVNLGQISKPGASSQASLCIGCSETMLSHIFLIQDMLDSLVRKLSKSEDPSCCVQCIREESMRTLTSNVLKMENLVTSNGTADGEHEPLSSSSAISEPKDKPVTNLREENNASPKLFSASDATSEAKRPKKSSSRRNSRRASREVKGNGIDVFSENGVNRNNWQTDFLYNVSAHIETKYMPHKQLHQNISSSSFNSSPLTSSSSFSFFDKISTPSAVDSEKLMEQLNFSKPGNYIYTGFDYSTSESTLNYRKSKVAELDKPDDFISGSTYNHTEEKVADSSISNYSGTESNSCSLETDLDDSSKSDDSGTEIDLEDSTKSKYSGTESHFEADLDDSPLTECSGLKMVFEDLKKTLDEKEKIIDQNVEKWNAPHGYVAVKDGKSSEAFVTICRNNAEALGSLVLGCSLLLSRTSRKLCVLVFDDVNPVFKESLSSIFHVVQHVRHLKSVEEKKIDYLRRMNLEKLNVWNLVQFSKCVFLNPDCLVLRNCDDLFQHEELSAVPDTGWPDCFNAGVFVFTPSIDTLAKLVELSQVQGQNNEGDQMLLNAYFNSWSSDISKKLSFIYNLTNNSSYTYKPAFQRFGHNVRIVQFLGCSKPWGIKFFPSTDQLDGDGNDPPKQARFFSEWINIFKIAVIKRFPQDVYTYSFNQRSISAEDIGFVLCSASFKSLDRNSFHILPDRRAKSCSPEEATNQGKEQNRRMVATEIGNVAVSRDSQVDSVSLIEMKKWEEGRIDYEGCDSSEKIINRLSFLIHQSV